MNRLKFIVIILIISIFTYESKCQQNESKRKFRYSKTSIYDAKSFGGIVYSKKLISVEEESINKDSTYIVHINDKSQITSIGSSHYDEKNRLIKDFSNSLGSIYIYTRV